MYPSTAVQVRDLGATDGLLISMQRLEWSWKLRLKLNAFFFRNGNGNG